VLIGRLVGLSSFFYSWSSLAGWGLFPNKPPVVGGGLFATVWAGLLAAKIPVDF
jgi:hypothetical protein